MALRLNFSIPPWLVRALDSPRFASWFRPSLPPVAVEIGSRALVSVAIARDAAGRPRLERHRRIDLPPGLVQPSLLKPLASDIDSLREHLRAAVEGLPGFDGRLTLLLPDRIARITTVDLDREAGSRAETGELIRWKLKRATPFRVEDGRIAYQAFAQAGGGIRCLVSLVPAFVVTQLEEAVSGLGWSPGLVDLSTFQLWNVFEQRLPVAGDALVLNVNEDFATLIVARAREPLFVRVKAPVEGGAVAIADILTEIQSTLLYYHDRVKGAGILEAWLRGSEDLVAGVEDELVRRHGIRTQRVDAPGVAGAESLDPVALSSLAPALGAALGG